MLVSFVVAFQIHHHNGSGGQAQDWSVSIVPSMFRIAQRQPVTAVGHYSLRAARGEYACFQIVISAAAVSLTGVQIKVPDFVNDSGTIPSSQVTLYGEHYIRVTNASPDPGGSNRPLGKGWYPDALIPMTGDGAGFQGIAGIGFDVNPTANSPVWVDIRVPDDAIPGDYVGIFRITAAEGERDVTVLLQVRNFSLPLAPTLKSSFGMHEPALTDRRIHELLIEHRVMPESVNPEDSADLVARFGLNTTSLRFYSNFNKATCTMNAPPSLETIRATSQLYPKNLDIHLYSADEIDSCPHVFSTVRQWGQTIHLASSRIRHLVTVAPSESLFSDGAGRPAVDIWPLLPKLWDQYADGIAQARALGSEIWAYTALVQDNYSPKWEIDFAPINYRIFPGFLAQSMDLTGILYWRVESWTRSPFEDLRGYSISGHFYPGEGMLIYPPWPGGPGGSPNPSMRLKWIRQGVQDYEYTAILKRLGRGDWAMNLARSAATNWHQWTRDPNLVESVHDQMGAEIDRIYTSKARLKSARDQQ